MALFGAVTLFMALLASTNAQNSSFIFPTTTMAYELPFALTPAPNTAMTADPPSFAKRLAPGTYIACGLSNYCSADVEYCTQMAITTYGTVTMCECPVCCPSHASCTGLCPTAWMIDNLISCQAGNRALAKRSDTPYTFASEQSKDVTQTIETSPVVIVTDTSTTTTTTWTNPPASSDISFSPMTYPSQATKVPVLTTTAPVSTTVTLTSTSVTVHYATSPLAEMSDTPISTIITSQPPSSNTNKITVIKTIAETTVTKATIATFSAVYNFTRIQNCTTTTTVTEGTGARTATGTGNGTGTAFKGEAVGLQLGGLASVCKLATALGIAAALVSL